MFIESEWLKLLFLLSDTQSWIMEMEKDLFRTVPGVEKKKLFRKTYYLSASAFAHIIERHYHKIPRHMEAAKFIISVPDIMEAIRKVASQPALPVPGSLNVYRMLDTGEQIGFDRSGKDTSLITVISGPGGNILTAFPGTIS